MPKRIHAEIGAAHVHVMRTGGTSLRAALDRVCRGRAGGLVREDLTKHATAAEVRDALGSVRWRELYTFVVVRNPWDHVVSIYRWWLEKAGRWPPYREGAEAVRRLARFEAFLDASADDWGRFLGATRLAPQLCDEAGAQLVEHVARFEDLEAEWDAIATRLGVEPCPLPALNVSERRPYREYYDDRTRRVVAERTAWTIERFGYRF